MHFNNLPKWLLKLIRFPPRIAYALGFGPLIGHFVLLLTTTGRKSGLPRVTPLQYEETDGIFYVASARGSQADWYRNIVAYPSVSVRVKNRFFHAPAQPTTDPTSIADFLELRLRRHPRMIGTMLRAEGLPSHPTHEQLEQFAAHLNSTAVKIGDGKPTESCCFYQQNSVRWTTRKRRRSCGDTGKPED